MTGPDAAVLWPQHERRVMDIAYRMLGSLADAEDIAQEVFLRLARADVATIENPAGWLATVTARLCLDHLRSAHVSRTRYVGPWLPEPLVALPGAAFDPADRVTLDDSVRLALLVVLERLSPAERTAFVLHDVFAMPFDDIASIVGRTAQACRKLASRARRRVREEPRFPVDPGELQRTVERFRRACGTGDFDGLVALLEPHATGEFDSGGLLPGAPSAPVTGARRVASILLTSFDRRPVRFTGAAVNGEPGIVVTLRGRIVTVISLEVRRGRVQRVRAVGNPRKLRGRRS